MSIMSICLIYHINFPKGHKTPLHVKANVYHWQALSLSIARHLKAMVNMPPKGLQILNNMAEYKFMNVNLKDY